MRAAGLLLLVALACVPGRVEGGGAGYPRIANLWGGGPESADYERWARYDLLVMGGGSAAAWRRFHRELRARNREVLLLGTAPLMNIGAPAATPWMRDEWFLRRPSGEPVRWWADQVYAPNLLNDDCLAALLEQTEKSYGDALREGALDGVFYDTVVGSATWYGEVDTDRDGRPDAPSEVNPRWHARQCLFFDRLRERWPGIRILANDADTDHAPHLHGRLFEGGPLLDRVADGSLSAADAIETLRDWTRRSLQPPITFALMTHPLGWQGWRVGQGSAVTTPGEVERVRSDYRRMRLGLLTTLMTDAYFAYDVGTVWYGLPFWYAEYDAPLGRPLGPAQEVHEVPPVSLLDWRAGRPADAFVVDPPGKVTPLGIEGGSPDREAGWRRLFATIPARVPLEPGKTYRIEAECVPLQAPTGTFQFNVRTARGGWERHDKGVIQYGGGPGAPWRIQTTVVPDSFEDYRLEWHLLGAGALRLRRVRVLLVGQSYFRRDFEGGVAILNPTRQPLVVRLAHPMRRLHDAAAPRHVLEVDDGSPGFTCRGAWETIAGEGHWCGATHRVAAKPGEVARWRFTAPAADRYTLFACVPGGKHLTDAALYAVRARRGRLTMVRNQRRGDGGWMKLGSIGLDAGERCEVTLRSAGAGATAADALRAESAARLNDGAPVTSVRLGPLDGTILLRGAYQSRSSRPR